MKSSSFKLRVLLKTDSSLNTNSFLNEKQMRKLNFCCEFVIVVKLMKREDLPVT